MFFNEEPRQDHEVPGQALMRSLPRFRSGALNPSRF